MPNPSYYNYYNIIYAYSCVHLKFVIHSFFSTKALYISQLLCHTWYSNNIISAWYAISLIAVTLPFSLRSTKNKLFNFFFSFIYIIIFLTIIYYKTKLLGFKYYQTRSLSTHFMHRAKYVLYYYIFYTYTHSEK